MTSDRGRFGLSAGSTPGTQLARSFVLPSLLLSRPLVIVSGEPLASRMIDESVHLSATMRNARGPKLTDGRQIVDSFTTCRRLLSVRPRSAARLRSEERRVGKEG